MDVWTAIKLRSAGLKNAYLGAFGEAKHVDYAGHAGLGRMNRIHLIMKLRCRASKVVNFITSTKRGKVTLCRRSSSRSFALIRSLFAEKNFKDYPKLRTRAKRCGADIFFLDEAGVRSDSALQRTWGAKGETPVVQTSGQRQGINAISAVNPQGAFWYNVYSGRMIAELFVTFLCDFMRRRRRPVFLVVDCHPTHRAKIVSAYIQSLKGKLELHFLRGYAPDLNPDGEGSRDERGGAVCYSAGPDFVG
jgi:hypothetical protein